MLGRLVAAMLVSFLLSPSLWAESPVQIRPDVVYGHKDGMALTFDVLTPAKPNGGGVLFIQSGGWNSTWREPKDMLPVCRPLLNKGFVVFLVRHGSAPKYAVPEAVADVRRSARYIHLRSKELGVDPKRLGVFGGSAGGHLSLVLGTTGDDGDPKAADKVLRQPSRVAAVVALYPPTDLRTWVTNPPEVIKKIPALKPPLTFDAAKEADCSPVVHASRDDAPTLMIHGDKDELVPISHSRNMLEALRKANVECKLVVIEGAAHGFNAKQNKTVVPAMVGWFEKHGAADGLNQCGMPTPAILEGFNVETTTAAVLTSGGNGQGTLIGRLLDDVAKALGGTVTRWEPVKDGNTWNLRAHVSYP
jgi:acetyl esterase/lipase